MNRTCDCGLTWVLRRLVLVLLPLALLVPCPRVDLAGPAARGPEAAFTGAQDPFDEIVYAVTVSALRARASSASMPYYGDGRAEVCLHPDTSPEDAQRILRSLPVYLGEDPENYNMRSRWSATATNPSTGVAGDPITITWSFVPDGTWADGGASDLFADFNTGFGGTSWQDKMRNAFARWHAVMGVTYVEVSDDGAAMPNNGGVLGVRGDVRIGGRSQDGAGNVLAYNYYPNGGDMVLDTDDVVFFRNALGNYGNLKNVVAHEHGHGHGLGHVIPTDCTKLLEPYICGPLNFVGPQDDDIRGGMRNYGDIYEIDDTNITPKVLGAVADSLIVTNVSIDNGQTDVDWYRITVPSSGLTIQVDPIGSSYFTGPDGGTETWVATDSISDLDVELYDASGTTLLVSATTAGLGGTEVLEYFVASAGDFEIKVYRKSGTGNNVQRYTMSIYSDVAAGVVATLDLSFSVSPNPFASAVTARFAAPSQGQYQLDVFDVTGRLCRAIAGTASGPGQIEVSWDGRNDRGAEMPSGVYFLRIAMGSNRQVARVVLAR